MTRSLFRPPTSFLVFNHFFNVLGSGLVQFNCHTMQPFVLFVLLCWAFLSSFFSIVSSSDSSSCSSADLFTVRFYTHIWLSVRFLTLWPTFHHCHRWRVLFSIVPRSGHICWTPFGILTIFNDLQAFGSAVLSTMLPRFLQNILFNHLLLIIIDARPSPSFSFWLDC